MKDTMLTRWNHHGDHIRSVVGDDVVLVKALRLLLPPYTVPGLALYRGHSAFNRLRSIMVSKL
jgi:hypothetical protein